MKIDIVM